MNDNTETSDFFGFSETDISDVDFFAVEDNAEEAPEGEESIPNPKPVEKSGGEEEEQEEEESLFETAEEEEAPEGGEDEEAPTITEGDSITTLNLLKEKGFLEYELEEGEELTDEKAAEVLEDSLDNLFEERIEELFENVPDILKEMNKFVLKGGDINVFLEKVATDKSTGLSEDMDIENEDNQELIIRHGLQEEGYDEDYITAQLEFLKDSKRMGKFSKTHFDRWNNKRKEEQNTILKSREAVALKDKTQTRALKGKVSTFLKENEEIAGFTVTKQDRKILPNYMSDRTVKLQNGNQITGMQNDLMRVLNSPTGSIQIAKLLKAANENGELNFENIKKTVETKVTKKVRDNVRRSKKSITGSGERKLNKKRPLADYFD